ncbi:MAG TPA: hypothetical protein VGJ51_18290 [Candidatus Angelobacter sp.]
MIPDSTKTTTKDSSTLELPASTIWPLLLAFGITLVFAGLVTSESVSALGAALVIAGVFGWFRNVLPYEVHESVPVIPEQPAFATTRQVVARLEVAHQPKRAWLPLEIYPVSAGVKGGLAGSVVMAGLAVLYGLISGNGIWYPVNLLVAGFFPGAIHATTAQIAEFRLSALLLAILIHLITSLLVGLLYGVMLPMFPRRPILLGGLIAPIMWSGLLYTTLDIINPVMNQRISWLWFVLSQVGFGVVAGLVVSRQQRIRTYQGLPFAVRAGIEAPGVMQERDEE